MARYSEKTNTDLARIPDMLTQRGFNVTDVKNFMSENYFNLLRRHWNGNLA